jgi:hypothetical protein
MLRHVIIMTILEYIGNNNIMLILIIGIGKIYVGRCIKEEHNHPITENFGGCALARKLSAEEKVIVRELGAAGASSATTLSFLKAKTGNKWSTRREVNNERALSRKEYLAGRSPIQALYEEVIKGDFVYDFQIDSV